MDINDVLSGGSSNFSNFTPEQRRLLAELYRANTQLCQARSLANERLASVLEHPEFSDAMANPVIDYMNQSVDPLKAEVARLRLELVKTAVDVDGLKQTLPMLVLATMQSVNLSLILLTFDVDIDDVAGILQKLKNQLKPE